MEDQFARQIAQNYEEKTGIDKVRDLIEFEYFDEAITECNSTLARNKGDRDHLIQKFRAKMKADVLGQDNIPVLMGEIESRHPSCLADVEYVETKFEYLLKSNELNKARELLDTVKKVFHNTSKSSVMEAQLLRSEGNNAEALDLLNKGLTLNEYDGMLYEIKGDILLFPLCQPEAALEQYKYSMQMNKRNPSLFLKMAQILYDKHFHGEAVLNASVSLEQIRSSTQKNHLTQQQRECVLLRGKSLLFLKELEEAQSNFQRILDCDELCLSSRMGKAQACMLRGKSDQALAIFKKGEQLHPNCLLFAPAIALSYFLRKDFDNCEINLKKYFKKMNEIKIEKQGQQQNELNFLYLLLNYINFFYLDEPYAKAHMQKAKEVLNLSQLKLNELEMFFVENISSLELIKRSLLEYFQQSLLYIFTGLYRWYPEDLYPFLLKHENTEDVNQKLSRVFALIKNNLQKGIIINTKRKSLSTTYNN